MVESESIDNIESLAEVLEGLTSELSVDQRHELLKYLKDPYNGTIEDEEIKSVLNRFYIELQEVINGCSF